MVNFIKSLRGRSLAIVAFTALGLVSPDGAPALADGIPGVVMGTETGADPVPSSPAPSVGAPPAPVTPVAPPEFYTQAMLVGYAAAEQGDYQTALINFRRALAERPGDSYALRAIANMESYIAQERREIARQQRLATLQQQVSVAVAVSDWACAAATIDEMITLVPANSLDRSRLVTYRGELTSLLDARSDIGQWSSVCPG